MAVGDSIIIKQEAQPTPAGTPYFSYTTTVDMVITGWTTNNYVTYINSWIDSTQGYYGVLESSSLTSLNATNARSRQLIESGMTLEVTSNNNVNKFGLLISGFEI